MSVGDVLITSIKGVEYKVTKVRRMWASGCYYVAHDVTHNVFLSSFISLSDFKAQARSGYFFARDGFK